MFNSPLKKTTNVQDNLKRLLLVSSKCKYGALLEKAVKSSVVPILYNYENTTFDTLLALVSASLEVGEKVVSVGCVMTVKHAGIFMLHLDANQGVLGTDSVIRKTDGIGMFLRLLFASYVDRGHCRCRLDLFGAAVVPQLEKKLKEIESLIGVTVGVSKEPFGTDSSMTAENGNSISLGDMYFTSEKIRNWSNGSYQTIDLFEKIRIVGKGAFGTAVLYRKKDDNSLVILKEINMTELNNQERQLAMNETRVLKMLNHPNIICYYDTFEENGVLMIEMEYADNGTLAQFLSKQESALGEKEILLMFSQIMSGIRYMHEQKILHRDLKTANIFLTKDGFMKIGDFGVSKIMSSHNKGANTVLGTPYYISPEICEGKPYDEKSDIWALGCILHEMATRQKTFEGTNLPALVNKIMRGQIAPIPGDFSSDFRQLVYDMLHREPEMRPSAHIIENERLPAMISFYDLGGSESRSSAVDGRKDMRSVLYLYDTYAMTISPVEGFPSRIKIRQVAVGENHLSVVAMERIVYTWGDGSHGQLGHGSTESVTKPRVVEALKGKSVISVCCGSFFSVFISDNGIVMTCGDGRDGCLGHGDYVATLRPRLIETLLSVDVTFIACGQRHVVALGSEGEIYAWGNGKDGCLGTGNLEIHEEPTEVSLGGGISVREVRCSRDGTMFITDVGTLFACGNNKYNKLGLNERRGFLTALSNKLKLEVELKKKPAPVKSIKGVIDVSMGKNHTAVLTELGMVYMLGSNKHGQIGTGDDKQRNVPYLPKSLRKYDAGFVVCGDTYTAAGTSDGTILFWGIHFKQLAGGRKLTTPPSYEDEKTPSASGANLLVGHSHRRTRSTTSTVSFQSAMSLGHENLSISEGPSRTSSYQDVSSVAGDGTVSQKSTCDMESDSNASTPVNSQFGPFDGRVPEKIFTPTPVLDIQGSTTPHEMFEFRSLEEIVVKDGLDANANNSDVQIPQRIPAAATPDFAAYLEGLVPCHNNFYILVETNAPSSLKQSRDKEGVIHGTVKSQISQLNLLVPEDSQRNSVSSNEGGDEYASSDASELDSLGNAPTWIKEELKRTVECVQKSKDSEFVGSPAISDKNAHVAQQSRSKKQERRFVSSPSRLKSNVPSAVRGGKKLSLHDVEPPRKVAQRPSVKNLRSASPYMRRSPQQIRLHRLTHNRGRPPNRQVAGSPKQSKSPVGRNVRAIDHELRVKYAKLQEEKRAADERMKILQQENEKHLQEMRILHEREKFEQEQKLHSEIAKLREELEQQHHMKEKSYDTIYDSKNSKLRRPKDSIKNSKICVMQ